MFPKVNTLTSDEITEMINGLDKVYDLMSSKIRSNYRMEEDNGDHFGSVMMCMRHLHALMSHVIWQSNSPRFSDDGYWREKIRKLEKELKTY